MGILASGAAFSTYEGIHTITAGGGQVEYAWVNYLVLGIALLMEGTSLLQATRQVRQDATDHRRSVRQQLAASDDPTPRAVFTEDSAAVIGVLLAAAGVALHQVTGSAVWDGIASVLIGLLLACVAVLLARTSKRLLLGRQADTRMIRAIEQRLEQQPEIDDVVDLLTMMTGTDRVLLCARVDFVDTYTAGDIEHACVRIDDDLRAEFGDLDEIFIQPVPRTDQDLRDRVLRRYGQVLADE
ncbi:cation diffusion facilitator family transporter [Actinosynnema sp. ALI-1.44]|uniref:cation diffusion facilitator family transporter n=1 Tax=Actinosynnema sp. ALI-1.44 TaxID=1933779 RepID=UPI0026951DAA|nr:cation transporter [Actinosynnema sp. ALI-1.44]